MIVFFAFNLAIFALDLRRFSLDPTSFSSFFLLCFSLIVGVGLIFVSLMQTYIGYKFQLADLDVIEAYYLSGYFLAYLGIQAATLLDRTVRMGTRSDPGISNFSASSATRYKLYALGLLSLVVLSFYVALSGISFATASYAVRYEKAQGLGLLLVFFPAFLPLAAYELLSAESPRRFWTFAAAIFIYSCATIVVLSGYRQIAIAAVLLIVIIGVKKRMVSGRLAILAAIVVGPVSLVALSFARYSGEITTPFLGPLQAALYYIQGDLFPIDAALKSYWYCEYKVCPGFDVFANHLLRLVPRFLWTDKPEYMLDAAGFYTKAVVGYSRDVTLSSTIIGESILVAGWAAYIPIMIVSGFATKILGSIMQRSSGLLFYILLSQVYIGFFWVREGFENGIYRILMIILFLVVGSIAGPMLQALVGGGPQRQPLMSGAAGSGRGARRNSR